MSTISNNPSLTPTSYESFNQQIKKDNGFALSNDGKFLLLSQRDGNRITRTLINLLKLPEVDQKDLRSRVTELGSKEKMKALKNKIQEYAANTPGAVKTVAYGKWSFNSTKAKAIEELRKTMKSPELRVKMKVDETEYAIPAKAISEAGADESYVSSAIQHGKKLLSAINALPTAMENSSYESPIKSRKDMVDLMWALDAEAWETDEHYQSGSSSMYVSGTKIYDALAHAKQPDGTALCYSRGGKNDSSHLQPFPNSKTTQMGFDAYPKGQFATAERKEKLPYGRNTLLFGRLSRKETGFGQDRTFIKLESFGTGGLGNKIAHGLQYAKKVLLGMDKPTKESDFNEKIGSISKIVSSLTGDTISQGIPKKLLADFQSASKKGLTSLAKFIAEAKANNSNEEVKVFLGKLENNVSGQLEEKILKEYQMNAINHWKSEPENIGQSTLAYFMAHDQSGKEMILDLPNN